MFLKDHLKNTYQKAYFDKNHLMVENVINRWAHRFGIESLNELILKNQDNIKLIEEDQVGEKQNQINLELSENVQDKEESDLKSKGIKKSESNNYKIISRDSYVPHKNKSKYKDADKLPLPKINNLRKWINNEKKAS